jgi:hypothetical protein
MKSRYDENQLKEFMAAEELSETKLGDLVGMAASQISRALSTGRVSLGFHARFNAAMTTAGFGYRIELLPDVDQECPGGCGGLTDEAGVPCLVCAGKIGKAVEQHGSGVSGSVLRPRNR